MKQIQEILEETLKYWQKEQIQQMVATAIPIGISLEEQWNFMMDESLFPNGRDDTQCSLIC